MNVANDNETRCIRSRESDLLDRAREVLSGALVLSESELDQLRCEFELLIRDQAEENAGLVRQMRAAGLPTVRRVIKDTNGNDVIF